MTADRRHFGMPGERKVKDSTFPFLTGIGVILGLSLLAFYRPPLLWPNFIPAFALIGGLPLGIIRIRNGQLSWLGVRYALAGAAAVGLGFVFALAILLTFFWQYYGLEGLVLFIALGGALSGWFAFCAARWADKGRIAPRTPTSNWNPRTWGAAGVLGASVAVLAAAVLGANLARPIPGLGPTGLGILLEELASGVLLVLGLAGLIMEVRGRRTPRLSA